MIFSKICFVDPISQKEVQGMAKRFRSFVLLLSVFAAGFILMGCSRSANDKQMQALEESKASVQATQDKIAQLEKENADLKAQLAQKQQELEYAKAEREKVRAKLGQ
jgi:septal ring factor EnvC (AmiA/AmiB activator)